MVVQRCEVEELWRRRATVEVVGLDNFELSRLLPHEVTIVGYDTEALGTISANRLFERIQGDESPAAETLLPTQVSAGAGWSDPATG